MKRLSIALAAATMFATLPALAADLGGDCCSALEERIAELEATSAKKGNRKVSLTISGQINKALVWSDVDSSKVDVIDNANSPSVFRFVGSSKLSATMEAGFIYEFGVDKEIVLRHAAVWLGSSIGKVWIGQTSTATDGIVEITVANTAVASRMMFGTTFDGNRLELVKYETPTFAGFVVSTSYAPSASAAGDDVWDVALRYSGEFSGFRMAAGVGYRNEQGGVIPAVPSSIIGYYPVFWWWMPVYSPYVPAVDVTDVRMALGSASMMHMGTGLFVNMSAARELESDVSMWHIQGGIERNFFGVGATTLFVGYSDTNTSAAKMYEAGIVQAFDSLGADIYLNGRLTDDDAKAVIGGVRIKF